jgi:adenylosuccinate lyase
LAIERYAQPEMTSVWSDDSRLQRWLRIEILACEAWAARGAISPEDLGAIRRATFDASEMAEIERTVGHDIIAFLTTVNRSVGSASRHIHRGLTSSDVVDTAFATQLVESAELILGEAGRLRAAIAAQAVQHRTTLMAGRTHGMLAEPTTFGLKLASWVAEMDRAIARLRAGRDEVAVGSISGAVGTHATIPPDIEEMVLASLGLRADPAPTQVVARDRHAAFMSALALAGTAVERFATEVRHLQRSEVGEVLEPFGEGQKGSSAMPHKRNPVLCERICGLSRVIRGHLVTALENCALWHERDISHSSAERLIFPDACKLLHYMLREMTRIVDGWEVHPERMRANLDLGGGLVYSQRVLLALTERGLSREDAYAIVQSAARRAWSGATGFRDAIAREPRVAELIGEDVLATLFDPAFYLDQVDITFERLGLLQPALRKEGT